MFWRGLPLSSHKVWNGRGHSRLCWPKTSKRTGWLAVLRDRLLLRLSIPVDLSKKAVVFTGDPTSVGLVFNCFNYFGTFSIATPGLKQAPNLEHFRTSSIFALFY